MAKNENLYLTASGNNRGTDFENADGTNDQDIFVAGSEGSIVRSIAITSSDAVDRDLLLKFYDGSSTFTIGVIQVLAGSGTVSSAMALSLLNADVCPWAKQDNAGNLIILLEKGEKLKAAMDGAVTAAKKVTVVVFGEDF